MQSHPRFLDPNYNNFYFYEVHVLIQSGLVSDGSVVRQLECDLKHGNSLDIINNFKV